MYPIIAVWALVQHCAEVGRNKQEAKLHFVFDSSIIVDSLAGEAAQATSKRHKGRGLTAQSPPGLPLRPEQRSAHCCSLAEQLTSLRSGLRRKRPFGLMADRPDALRALGH